MNTTEKLISIFQNLFGIDISKINSDDSLRDDLKLDSINLVNLQVEIEDCFNIRFNPLEADLALIFKTVGSLSRFLQSGEHDE
jgi:acyl carrier protein